MANPKGDPAVMQKYLDAAKAEGVTPTSGGELLTIATNADPGNQTAQVAQAQLNKMGFKLNYRKVPQDTLYTKFCGVAEGQGRDLPERGLAQGLLGRRRRYLDPTFNGDEHPAAGQLELVAARRPGAQQRDERGRRSSPTAGPGATAWADDRQEDHRARAGDRLGLGHRPR